MIHVFIDGASAGNPGKVGVGYAIYKGEELLAQNGVALGIQTNNFAEYMALIFALIAVLGMGEKRCEVFSDSQLLVEQINGNYKVRNKNIYALYVLAKHTVSRFESFRITHIPREENTVADKLAGDASGFLV